MFKFDENKVKSAGVREDLISKNGECRSLLSVLASIVRIVVGSGS